MSHEATGLAAGALNADLLASTDVQGCRGVAVQITGTFTGTLTFQVSNDGVTWTSTRLADQSTGTASATATTAGLFAGTLLAKFFRVRMTAYTSGTANGVVELFERAA